MSTTTLQTTMNSKKTVKSVECKIQPNTLCIDLRKESDVELEAGRQASPKAVKERADSINVVGRYSEGSGMSADSPILVRDTSMTPEVRDDMPDSRDTLEEGQSVYSDEYIDAANDTLQTKYSSAEMNASFEGNSRLHSFQSLNDQIAGSSNQDFKYRDFPSETTPFLDGMLPEHLPDNKSVQDVDRLTTEQCKEHLAGFGVDVCSMSPNSFKSRLARVIGFSKIQDQTYIFEDYEGITGDH